MRCSDDGTARCWGVNGAGQLGNGTTTNSNLPVTVSGLVAAVTVTAGRQAYSCALLDDGTVRCWGTNFYGQLGNGTSGPGADSTIPVAVANIP